MTTNEAARPALSEFRCSGTDESGQPFTDTLWARGADEAETAAEIRWPDVGGWKVEAAGGEAEHPRAVALRQIRGLATWYSAKAKGEIYRLATDALGGDGGTPADAGPWHALECAQFWLQEEAASERSGPPGILRLGTAGMRRLLWPGSRRMVSGARA